MRPPERRRISGDLWDAFVSNERATRLKAEKINDTVRELRDPVALRGGRACGESWGDRMARAERLAREGFDPACAVRGLSTGINIASGVTPLSFNDAVTWYRADTGLDQASAALNSGSTAVSQFTDRTSGGRNAVQATGANQPVFTWQDATANNYSTATFNGTSDFLKYAGTGSVFLNQPCTIYAVFRYSVALISGNGYILLDGTDVSDRLLSWSYNPSGTWLWSSFAGTIINQTTGPSINTWYACAWVYNNPTSTTLYVSSRTAMGVTTNAGAEGIKGITLGSEQAQAAGFWFQGKWAEASWHSTAHSAARVTMLLTGYYGPRYAITIS